MGVKLKIKFLAHETHETSIKIILFINYIKSQLHVIMKTEPSYIFQHPTPYTSLHSAYYNPFQHISHPGPHLSIRST